MVLVHELSWSASRASTFHACKRRYYLQYYLAWMGWDRNASDERKRAYMLKKMTSMPMLAGDALHRALEEWFQARESGREFTQEEVEQSALAIRTRATGTGGGSQSSCISPSITMKTAASMR